MRSAPWTGWRRPAPSAQPLPPARGSVNKAAWLPARLARPLKGKEIRDFQAACFGNASGRDNYRMRSGWPPQARVISDWAPVLDLGPGELEPMTQSPELQNSHKGRIWKSWEALGDLCPPHGPSRGTQPPVVLRSWGAVLGWESDLGSDPGAGGRERRRPRRLI